MSNEDFFLECTDATRVKQFIIENYFTAWASVIVNTLRKYSSKTDFAYIDLFCGPGIYEDGTESTPLLIIKKILSDPQFYSSVHLYFNDKEAEYVRKLQEQISLLPDIKKLTNEPILENYTVDKEFESLFNEIHLMPSLTFIDPCGYDGLSMDLVCAVVKDFGCDCIAFFNYSVVNRHMSNPSIPGAKLDSILCCNAKELANEVEGLTPIEREKRVMECIRKGVREKGIPYTMEFRFVSAKNRTSHYLLFFTKHFKGYEIMKEVMYKASEKLVNGIATFKFNLFDAQNDKIYIHFDYDNSYEQLKQSLLGDFKGLQIGFIELFERHSVGQPFVKSQYKKVLKEMEDNKLISTIGRRTSRGFADYLTIQFPG